MSIYYTDDKVVLHHGDCLDVLATLPDASVDAVVTDPPYGLANTDPAHVAETITRWINGERDYLPGGRGFMGKEWDAFVPPVAVWDECLRVLKPGGHVLTFAGSRTVDLVTLGLRMAGFDIRDSLAWLYGSGFPKSLDVSKAIDKVQGATGTYGEPKSAAHAGWLDRGRMRGEDGNEGWQRPWMQDERALSNAARKYEAGSPEAQAYAGWGTALKPAFEPIVMARKPLTGTVAANVLEHGTGALNIDACRIDMGADYDPNAVQRQSSSSAGMGGLGESGYKANHEQAKFNAKGRWPANVILDESQAAVLDEQSGTSRSRVGKPRGAASGNGWGMTATGSEYDDTGGASRFFYVIKAPKSERPVVDGVAHPTVKPVSLMSWLVRLVTPPGGTVLEPFAGSGTTVEAAMREGFNVVAVEREADYLPLILARIDRENARQAAEDANRTPSLFDEEAS